jgi:hypothetical protein
MPHNCIVKYSHVTGEEAAGASALGNIIDVVRGLIAVDHAAADNARLASSRLM